LAGTIRIVAPAAVTPRASQKGNPARSRKEDAMLRKTLIPAAAIALSVALPAVAQTNFTDDEIKSHCRLSAAVVFPDERNAFDNEMRARLYQRCLAADRRRQEDDAPFTEWLTGRKAQPVEPPTWKHGSYCEQLNAHHVKYGVADWAAADPVQHTICYSPRLTKLHEALGRAGNHEVASLVLPVSARFAAPAPAARSKTAMPSCCKPTMTTSATG
jgi:hypothetical protein